ncbi:MAG: type II toxin-antitoxin system PemK/MazF family toxin [Venatoribacter sp.]
MGTISVGDVVFVSFPFSDLSASKKRPALVLAVLDKNDLILCQITSKAYADKNAVEITKNDFPHGELLKTSYVRPSKFFTANTTIVFSNVAQLKETTHQSIVLKIIKLIS